MICNLCDGWTDTDYDVEGVFTHDNKFTCSLCIDVLEDEQEELEKLTLEQIQEKIDACS
tara:strand:+ start:636 stop:812 length:177 start_codon:yes stop_codon:yes gene_type:complete